jgi:hypothetical protein
MNEAPSTRPLTDHERALALWMLEHGKPEALQYIEQLVGAEVTSWRCVCGCASFNFKITGKPEAPAGVSILGDYVVGEADESFGIFIYQSDGILSGVEVYSLAADAARALPEPDQLRPANFEAVQSESTPHDDA